MNIKVMKRLVSIILMIPITIACIAQPPCMGSYPDSLIKKRLNTIIATETGIYIAGLSFLSFIWYHDKERVPFHFYDDSKGYLQMDKFGHAYSAYHESYTAYYAFRWAGMDKKRALIYGCPV
ncbi:MAG: hypothetical protein JXR41_09930, partial [Bacteroidales bacterium]|nr:hypothetical protein [Bacteroidales bacterium]